MTSPEEYAEVAHQAVADTAYAFHFKVNTDDGRHLDVPIGYQIEEPPLFRQPYKAGKASPKELQEQLDLAIADARRRGHDPGIENADSVRKIAIQMGLGVDCSNFAYRTLVNIHDRLGLIPYPQTVLRPAAEIRHLHSAKDSWRVTKGVDGSARSLTPDEQLWLYMGSDRLSIASIARVFGKDPEFILGSAHMCGEKDTEAVPPQELLPGDLIAFKKAGTGAVSHTGVIEQASDTGGVIRADFWHSWHTRGFDSGVRRDSVTIEPDSTMRWSHQGLEDPTRYQAYDFRRPAAMALAYANLT